MEAMATRRTETGSKVEAKRLDSDDMGRIRAMARGLARWNGYVQHNAQKAGYEQYVAQDR
ncbi:hypothetical protein PCA10_24500 [Metapseudomonas resinovorans NBRC 106553]|uniref:Uncharacterized protein n=1 Tax=Metapseudomonas resinovorans NBRC 106553 TaxID=1245471 RepID=S6AEM1_METRE|nr:hypothetical protein PCA10_24500 [Pseudomonas resinovorans NBRC 106553]